MNYDLLVIGGGAAGFFCAIQCAERNPELNILILEKSSKFLSKVRISGGGRCNVTHGCFDPGEMTEYYPRGNKELRGPFHKFLCGDMMGWLSDQGVETKIEEDGRVFPVSDSSESIIACFMRLCENYGITLKTSSLVTDFQPAGDAWEVHTREAVYTSKSVMLATGSTPAIWDLVAKKGHSIIAPVPSLFTFNIKNKLLDQLPGLSVPEAQISIQGTKFQDTGPLLITHWGLSGPAILKLSAWAARELYELDYNFQISVNWCGLDQESLRARISEIRQDQGKKQVQNLSPHPLPKRLWHRMLDILGLKNKNYASLRSAEIEGLLEILLDCKLQVQGKSTFKDEFVTCGGIDTKEVNFKTMESKLHPGLYFAGEVLNIDAVTGGFNFQAARTEAYIAAAAISGQ